MDVKPLGTGGVLEIVPDRLGDARGFIAETYNAERFARHGIGCRFVQDNQSTSGPALTLRGLHFQAPPFAQAKLVRVLRGRILDVAVDIRRGSPGFGRAVATEISAERFNQVFVPIGFAHGFLTLEPETVVFYKVSAPYSKAHDRAVRWDDRAIGIDWGLGDRVPVLSDKDRAAPLLAEIEPLFAAMPAGAADRAP